MITWSQLTLAVADLIVVNFKESHFVDQLQIVGFQLLRDTNYVATTQD